MKTRTEIRIESHDMARQDMLTQAYTLVGGPHPDERKSGDFDHFTVDEVKMFVKIKANIFTLDEVRHAVKIIHRRRREMYRDAETLEVFTDPKIQAGWANGVKASADLAVRLADDFLSNIMTDLEDMQTELIAAAM